jgi:hypothetical protein
MKILKNLHSKVGFLLTVMFAAAAGGLTTGIVLAAVPDSSGQIHGCYRTGGLLASGALRVVDSENSQTCNGNETALNWSQGGGARTAYVAFTTDASGNVIVDGTHTSGITNSKVVGSGNNKKYCFQVSFAPKFGMGLQGANATQPYILSIEPGTTEIPADCGAGFNAEVWDAGLTIGYTYMFMN